MCACDNTALFALSLYLDKVADAASAVGHEPAFCLQTWGFSTTQETGFSDAAGPSGSGTPRVPAALCSQNDDLFDNGLSFQTVLPAWHSVWVRRDSAGPWRAGAGTSGHGVGPLPNYDGHIKESQTQSKAKEGLWFHGLTEAFMLIRPEKVKCWGSRTDKTGLILWHTKDF